MNDEIQATYRAADDVLRLMMTSSGYATQAHELNTVATFGDDSQDVERDVQQTRTRLAQRLEELKNLDNDDIQGVTGRLNEHWQRLQSIRDYSYADAGPYAIGELLTTVIPIVRRWIRETCGWLELGEQFPVVLPVKSYTLCNETADGFPLSIEATQKFRDMLLREQSILLKNAALLDIRPTIEPQKPRSPQCTIPQWLKAFRDAKAFFGEQRKFESHMKQLGQKHIAHKPTPRGSWEIELWYLDEKGIKVPSMI